jgi:hypothetical protein
MPRACPSHSADCSLGAQVCRGLENAGYEVCLVIWLTAALVPAYTGAVGIGRNADMEETLTTAPPPLSWDVEIGKLSCL